VAYQQALLNYPEVPPQPTLRRGVDVAMKRSRRGGVGRGAGKEQ